MSIEKGDINLINLSLMLLLKCQKKKINKRTKTCHSIKVIIEFLRVFSKMTKCSIKKKSKINILLTLKTMSKYKIKKITRFISILFFWPIYI